MDVAGLDQTSGVTAVAAGQMHNCALFASGAVKCWGDNTWGQLRNNTKTNSASLVDVDPYYTPVAVAGWAK